MTRLGVDAFAELAPQAETFFARLTADDWSSPSACDGWAIRDIAIHLTCTLREVVEPSTLPAAIAGDIEQTNEVAVAAFRHQTIGETLADYTRLWPLALEQLRELEDDETGRIASVSFENAGTYPAHLMVDSLVFDHYCHLAVDSIGPRGPIASAFPDPTGDYLRSTTSWLIAGLPQMSSPSLFQNLSARVRLTLIGPGGETWDLCGTGLTPADRDRHVAVEIVSDTAAFLRWGTHRVPWRDAGVRIIGDYALAARTLDHIRVF